MTDRPNDTQITRNVDANHISGEAAIFNTEIIHPNEILAQSGTMTHNVSFEQLEKKMDKPNRSMKNVAVTQKKVNAGMKSLDLNTISRHAVALQRSNLRSYADPDETQRDIELTGIEVKNFHYYNQMDNLWNETSRLDPNIAKYSACNIDPQTTFKQTITDLPMVAQKEREDNF